MDSEIVSASEPSAYTKPHLIPPENLAERAGRWRKSLADAATGPLVIAAEVMELAKQWDAFRAEAGGLDCTTWLREQFGGYRGLAWFKHRHEAVKKLGEACRRTMHHEVAVWVSRNVPDQYLKSVRFLLIAACKENGGNPLNLGMAIPRIREITGKSTRRPRRCKRCAMLEAKLKEMGQSV